MQTNSGGIRDCYENDQRRQSTNPWQGKVRWGYECWERGAGGAGGAGGGLPPGFGIKTVNKDTRYGGGSLLFQSRQKQWEMIRRACGCQFAGHRIINKISLTRTHPLPLSRSVPTRTLTAPVTSLEFIPTSPVATLEQNTTNFTTTIPRVPQLWPLSTHRPFLCSLCI